MNHLNVAVLDLRNEWAGKIAKKGAPADFTPYHLKTGDAALTLYEPSLYPDKLQPLLFSLYLADHVLLIAREITKEFGEMLVACDVCKKPGFIIYDGIDPEQLAPLIKNTEVENYKQLPNDPNAVRETLVALPPHHASGPVMLPIDASFAVKSVGTVALSVCKRGEVHAYDNLEVFPSKKPVTIRSIQVHDEDVKTAGAGARTGLALKNLEASDITRGDIIAAPGSLKAGRDLKGRFEKSRFFREPVAPGEMLFVSAGMQYGVGRIGHVDDSSMSIVLDKPMAFDANERVFIAKPEGKLRIVGGMVLEA